jgi:hypothetical protein
LGRLDGVVQGRVPLWKAAAAVELVLIANLHTPHVVRSRVANGRAPGAPRGARIADRVLDLVQFGRRHDGATEGLSGVDREQRLGAEVLGHLQEEAADVVA